MRVLIIGATGFIGLPAAQALVRAGHVVFGLARTPEKAKLLAVEEIVPVSGDASDPSKWIDLVATIDVIIEAIGGTMELPQLSTKVLNAVSEASQKLRPAGSAKIAYIYTSGVWVHGDDRKNYVTDTTPIVNPAALVAWRPALEKLVATHTVLNGIVVRPGLVYGRSASLLASAFAAPTGKVLWPGTPGGRLSVVHTDDLAEFYLLASEKSAVLAGQIFDIVNDVTESVDDVLARVVKVNGASGYEYFTPTNPFEAAIASTNLIRPHLARALLGWVPRKAGLVDGLETYYAAFKAANSNEDAWSAYTAAK
ncbi:hypothetical protein EUX98_g2672 [Antrodiella citrinella]|uniref:NAD-dependent epimerase/dehydratase domain-containing protein n=1 Tax=Antrodiella citrinella TaxID=2447956 RepID=A0A4S4N178_9APHY|nr:hypothetical protein EUX98_g2672 [Antrodiella citrinella]